MVHQCSFPRDIRAQRRFITAAAAAACAVLGAFAASPAASALTLSTMFSNHMVLQQNMRDPVWGRAKPGARITVRFAGQKATATTRADGWWRTALAPLKADATSQTMTVSDAHHHIIIHDILIGEVWLCSGQSNMQYPMTGWFGRKNLAMALAHAAKPAIRLYFVPMLQTNFAGHPRHSAPAKWRLCTPQTAAGFSAVGYLFGRDLQKQLHVPIGLIDSDWGGTNIEAWTPAAALLAQPRLTKDRGRLRGA